jgi:hypothetical protein
MHRLEREYRELAAAGLLDELAAARAIALDRGALFSLFDELRLGLYASVAAITAGIGLLIKQNLDRIGPLSLIAALALVASACYLPAIRSQLRGARRTIGGDYLLLLGALILSADLGYAVSRFGWLGGHASGYLLTLALLHAVTAYTLNSRLVLSVSLTSLAAWLGIDSHLDVLWSLRGSVTGFGLRALACAAVIAFWREIHRRCHGAREFTEVFAHFAANIGFWGALALCLSEEARIAGILVLTALAFVSMRKGVTAQQEAFVVYGIAYSALGLCILDEQLIRDSLLATTLALLIVLSAVIGLWQLHRRLSRKTP